MQNLEFAKGFNMAERIDRQKIAKNTNHNRIRLKVRENPKTRRKNQIKIQRKKDRSFKMFISFLTLAIVITLGYFLSLIHI